MNYQDELKVMMWVYPGLFPTEGDALNHLFFVNGTGREWVAGELVDRYETGTVQQRIEKAYRDRQHEDVPWTYYDRHLPANDEELKEAQEHELQKRKEHIETFAKLGRPDVTACYFDIYPICRYAGIANLPDDIKPDWLEAAKKALDVAARRTLRELDIWYLIAAHLRVRELEG